MRAMIDGQRFFLRAFQTGAARRADRAYRHRPIPTDLSDEALIDSLPALREDQLSPERHLPDGRRATIRWRCSIPRLRVRGIDNLRVCDLSAMPNINAGNTNAPAMMLGSRCADFVAEGGRRTIAG